MATTPTQEPVSSESPRDLKFNAGKIDEFVTSLAHKYADRFGGEHYTIEGLRQLAQQAIADFGWVPFGTFQEGATLTLPNHILKDEADGEYYRWDGVLPKLVAKNSTPQSSGGFGEGAWISVGDSALRSTLASSAGSMMIGHNDGDVGKYINSLSDYILVTEIVTDTTVDSRNVIFSQSKKVYIPSGTSLRCNLLPEDDIRKFTGSGKILTKDLWGNEHVFDVNLAANGSLYTVKGRIHQAAKTHGTQICSVGALGDSITDGAWGKPTWTENPNTGSPLFNLNSTNYDHSANSSGGSHSWIAHFGQTASYIASRWSATRFISIFNASLNGRKLSDGWAYRNFDYGFFQNSAYGNRAPDSLIIAMGWNDYSLTDYNDYLDKFDALIRKAWGYGCAVALVTVNRNQELRASFEDSVKSSLMDKYKNLEYYDLSEYLQNKANSDVRNIRRYYTLSNGGLDVTHPQEMGQAAMGDAFSYAIFRDSFIPSFSSGDKLLTSSADKYWDCVTPSNKHSTWSQRVASGSAELEQLGYVAAADVESENTTLSTIVFCNEPNMTLSILEPFTGNFTTTGRNHTISVFASSGKYLSANNSYRVLHSAEKIASGIIGSSRVLSTYIGRLSYGINLIQVTYDGAPTRVWAPILIFGNEKTDGVNLAKIRSLAAVGNSREYLAKNDQDTLVGNLYDGSIYARMPDWFSSSSGHFTNVMSNAVLSDLCGVIINYKALRNDGIAIRRNGAMLEVSELTNGALSSWLSTGVSATSTFDVSMSQSSSGTIGTTILISSGSQSYTATFSKTGGTLGVFVGAAAPSYFTLSMNSKGAS